MDSYKAFAKDAKDAKQWKDFNTASSVVHRAAASIASDATADATQIFFSLTCPLAPSGFEPATPQKRSSSNDFFNVVILWIPVVISRVFTYTHDRIPLT